RFTPTRVGSILKRKNKKVNEINGLRRDSRRFDQRNPLDVNNAPVRASGHPHFKPLFGFRGVYQDGRALKIRAYLFPQDVAYQRANIPDKDTRLHFQKPFRQLAPVTWLQVITNQCHHLFSHPQNN
ncbi:MAG: hypothetical protein PHP02_00780, partial [Eubacteriales bacterium]|nr:hypothetical protein [Eubacteriales bacterium]